MYFLQIGRFFHVILNLHNSKTTCDRRKPIIDLESTSKNTLREKIKNARNYQNFTTFFFHLCIFFLCTSPVRICHIE